MFNSPVIDLVILLSFTYFIGSLILSAINEAIAGGFRLRQSGLKTGLENFFLSSSWRSFVKYQLLESVHIQSLMKAKGRLPAYIPARNFVLALIENLDGEKLKAGEIEIDEPGNNDKFIKNSLPPEILIVLKTLMKQAANSDPAERLKEFERRLEEFYNLTMDRVTGRYKTGARKRLLILGTLLAVLLNLDTVKIVNDALRDKSRLSKTVDNISANIAAFDSLRGKSILVEDSLGKTTISASSDNAKKVLLTYEETTGYRLGFRDKEDFITQWKEDFWKKLLGILLTAFALQLGSTYWFDMMNKAVNIRAAGRKPDENQRNTSQK